MHPSDHPGPPARPLVVTADADLLDDLLRLAAAAGVEVRVAGDGPGARREWARAPLVLVGADAAAGCARARLPRRDEVVVVGRDLDDAGLWESAVGAGAAHVVVLPEADAWIVERLADAAEGGSGDGRVLAVLGGRGGAGATSLACALAVTAARDGRPVLLVDADPSGGGVDLCFGGEAVPGTRWSGLVGTRGRVPAAALRGALPVLSGVSVLSCDRDGPAELPDEAVEAVLAAGRRAFGLVVVDLPRAPREAWRAPLSACSTALVVVPAEVRAAAAAARLTGVACALCPDVRAVVRGPSPAGLRGADVAAALGLPLAGELRPEPSLDRALERGEPPGSRPRGPLALLAAALLQELAPGRASAGAPAPGRDGRRAA